MDKQTILQRLIELGETCEMDDNTHNLVRVEAPQHLESQKAQSKLIENIIYYADKVCVHNGKDEDAVDYMNLRRAIDKYRRAEMDNCPDCKSAWSGDDRKLIFELPCPKHSR